ncbi:MAG: inorganic phosphate transporter [Deltaproteobacteria bacterium]|nr:inorganic phosphate transporter [Deltaproteobacteria bacterium]
MEFGLPILVIAIVGGLYMAWAIGANDVANAMGTSVGSGALTLKRAIIVAAVFEFAGAVLAGSSVSKTIRKGIVDPDAFAANPELLVFGMTASLLAAAVWLNIATRFGWPVSTTHSIVGAIVGFSAVGLGMDAVSWGKVGAIVASWVTSPLTSGIIAFVGFSALRKFVLESDDPLRRTRIAVPYLAFLTTLIITLVTLWKGLKHLNLDLSAQGTAIVAISVSFVGAVIARQLVSRLPDTQDPNDTFQFSNMERVFAVLQVYTACAVAFAHGSNDVANAIGPLAAVVATIQAGAVTAKSAVPIWMLLLGGVGIVVGLSTYGYKVMATVGEKITHLTPSRGYVAEFAAASTIVVASQLGMPISTTHTLIGAVIGVSLARGVAATNFGIIGQIALSWVITLPAGAGFAVAFFYLFKTLFG